MIPHLPTRLACLLAVAALLAACDAGLTQSDADDTLAKGKPDKETICHFDKEDDAYYRITVSERAVPAHMAHGDEYFDPSAIDGISCEPEVDGETPPPPGPEASCPCFDSAQLGAITPDSYELFEHDIADGSEIVALWGGSFPDALQLGYVCIGECAPFGNICQYRYPPTTEETVYPTPEEAEACKDLLLDEYASRVGAGTSPPCAGSECPAG